MNPITLVKGLLAEALDVPVSTEVKKDRPPRLVTISLDGDASDEFLLRPRVGLTCWGTSDLDAFELSVSAVDALREAALDHPYLSAVQLDAHARDQWDRTGEGRYYVLLDLTINTDD